MPRVLVVDDEPDLRFVARLLLERAGYEVADAPHGRAALELLRDQTVDLAVVDVQMPVMDGVALVQTLRSDPATAGLPIVVWSATPTDAVEADAVARKTDGLLDAVQRVLGRTT